MNPLTNSKRDEERDKHVKQTRQSKLTGSESSSTGLECKKHANPSAAWQSVTTRSDLSTLHEIIDHAVTLRRTGYLNDETFADLIGYAAAAFVETEIDKKIAHVFDNLFTPDRFMRYFR